MDCLTYVASRHHSELKLDASQMDCNMSEQNKNLPINRSKDGKNELDSPMAHVAKNAIVDQRHVDVTAMIRSLQRTEGVTDCFRRGLTDCDLPDCAWRKYCLSKQEDTKYKKDS